MATTTQFLNAMRSYLGVTEYPLGSNRTRVGVEFGWNGVPWCAETISVAAKKVGLGWFWSASTDVMEAWGRQGKNGLKWVSAGSPARPGDVAVWDYKRDGTANHVSVVESVRSDGSLVTIGGNESNRCQRAVRSRSGLRGFIRLPLTTSTTTTTTTVSSTLRLGSKGPAVTNLQNHLKFWGWYTGAIDGDFGPATEAAVKKAQSVLKVAVTGAWDTKTSAAFMTFVAAMKALSSAPTATVTRPTLRQGASGEHVRYLQQRLTAHGIATAVDGDFGPATNRSVLVFQTKKGIGADGIVGPLTWKYLG